MSGKLKPCPFCGSKSVVFEEKYGAGGYITCENCGTESDFFGDYETAIKHWNERVSDWVDINKRLPKEGEIVTLYDSHANKMCGGILKSQYANYRGDLRRVYYWDVLLDLDSLVCSGQYTHWRPLPEPPEVEE